MKESQKNTATISEEEKIEMLEDAKDLKRRADFRKAKQFRRTVSFEDYAKWLSQIQSLSPLPVKKFVEYKNVLL